LHWHTSGTILKTNLTFFSSLLRGGGELGKRWYHAGRKGNKLNSFLDFIACAEFLKTEGYTTSERLAAQAYSAGGLILGYIANERPDLFRALLLHVPFVDVISSMTDPSLPLTVHE